MANTDKGSKFKREIEELSRVSIRGRLLDKAGDTVVIQMNNSLFEIAQEDIVKISPIKSDQETNLVDVSLTGDAMILQKNLVTANQIAGSGDDESAFRGQGFKVIAENAYFIIFVDDTDVHFILKHKVGNLGYAAIRSQGLIRTLGDSLQSEVIGQNRQVAAFYHSSSRLNPQPEPPIWY
jgi:hypothetical protein